MLKDRSTFEQNVDLLGQIAMQWRGAIKNHKDSPQRSNFLAINCFMNDYEKAVIRLINSGKWFEMPPPEDQLPDSMMPKVFFDYWNLERKPSKPPPETDTLKIVHLLVWAILIVGAVLFALIQGCFQ